MAASSRAFVISRFAADHSFMLLQPAPPCLPFSHHFLLRPLLPSSVSRKRSSVPVNCLVSGVDGGGVSDDFVSTRNSGFDREFSVIANMLMKIEPLDTSLISKGVSDSAKDSMKETISAMLGLLPSDQFSVTVSASNIPFYRLLVSSIMTGYTLWNAEYRISLMRNFDIQSDSWSRSDFAEENHVLEVRSDETEDDRCADYVEKMDIKSIGALSPEALNYIQNLESELSMSEKELDEKRQENAQIESCMRENNNDLLEYLRSLESDMVTELSQPSSSEVEDIIRKLVQNILRQFYKEASLRNAAETEELHNSITASSRDYLAKLLFWCMLMGHHLRGLENRLHLSCAVGLL